MYVCARECNQQQAFQFPMHSWGITTSNARAYQNHQNYHAIVCQGMSNAHAFCPCPHTCTIYHCYDTVECICVFVNLFNDLIVCRFY